MTMRKAMTVFLAAIILCFACFASLHCVLLGAADDVTVTRQTLYGDPAVADGLNIRVRNHYENYLLWETALTLDSDPAPDTDFTFSNERLNFYDEVEASGIEFNILSDMFAVTNLFEVPYYDLQQQASVKYSELINAINSAIDAVPEGERREFTVDFAQYLEYYPLDGNVILSKGMAVTFSEFYAWTEGSDAIAKAINEFFRIPVEGVYTVDYTIDKTNGGSSYGAFMNLDYFLNASGVITPDACYFTFNTLREDGTVVDTSLIPGGYGIYRLPYDEKVLKLDELEMVYALDPAEGYDQMQLSADGKRIRLQTWQGSDLMLTVIDIATMTQVQKVKLLTESDEWYYDVTDYDDFILIVEDRRNSESMDQITVWEELPDGTWSHVFTVDSSTEIFPDVSLRTLFDRYSNAVDYKDGKLAVITHKGLEMEYYYYDDYCDLYVAVYDASGMTYAGTCEWNLSKVNSYYPNTTRIQTTYDQSLEASW